GAGGARAVLRHRRTRGSGSSAGARCAGARARDLCRLRARAWSAPAGRRAGAARLHHWNGAGGLVRRRRGRVAGAGATARAAAGMTVEVERDSQHASLEPGASVALGPGTRVWACAGSHRFLVSATMRPRAVRRTWLAGWHWGEQRFVFGSALVHLLVLGGLL